MSFGWADNNVKSNSRVWAGFKCGVGNGGAGSEGKIMWPATGKAGHSLLGLVLYLEFGADETCCEQKLLK